MNLSRNERIELAIKALTPEGKAAFIKMAEEYDECSVFWDDESATLTCDEFSVDFYNSH